MNHHRDRELCNDSLRYSRSRREQAERRREWKRRLRAALFTFTFVPGALVAVYCAMHGDPTGKLTFLAVLLMVPWVATFDLLGEAPQRRRSVWDDE